MNDIFLISEIGYEYNDNYWSENGGGYPVKYYKIKEEAYKVCAELNKKARKEAEKEAYKYSEDVAIEDLEFYVVIKVPLG